ncbi:hypothetical protein D8B26_005404 [Coccidioides posadasii str. Silveira]|uniref:uncharacterized protein n=1 Tax=Coccidioides posadasii (strain RMSCC 757 / Silveira) TaxID=443226 RepID=UPI001BF0F9E3|nr:hypothetical protein D8B26_005404 [Coccidioides posadasii str. Silveira]
MEPRNFRYLNQVRHPPQSLAMRAIKQGAARSDLRNIHRLNRVRRPARANMVKTRRLSALKTQREKWRIYDLSSPYVATTSTTKEAHEAMEIETTTPTDIGSCEPGVHDLLSFNR